MTRKLILLLGAAAVVGATLSIDAVNSPSEAGVRCYYNAYDTRGRYISAVASHRKGSVACSKAYKRCMRKVDRASRKGKFARAKYSGICIRII